MSNEDDKDLDISLGDLTVDTIDIDLGTCMADDVCVTGDIDITQPFGSSYYTIGDPMNTITLGSVGNPFTNTYVDPEITIGKYSLNEKKLEKLNALLDILSDDPEWTERINTQIAFNKLRNNNGD